MGNIRWLWLHSIPERTNVVLAHMVCWSRGVSKTYCFFQAGESSPGRSENPDDISRPLSGSHKSFYLLVATWKRCCSWADLVASIPFPACRLQLLLLPFGLEQGDVVGSRTSLCSNIASFLDGKGDHRLSGLPSQTKLLRHSPQAQITG